VTKSPSTIPRPERHRLDAVAVTATVLLGLLLGAVAWLAITPEPPNVRSGTPVAVIALPPPPGEPEQQTAAAESEPAATPEPAPPESTPAPSEPEPPPTAAAEPESDLQPLPPPITDIPPAAEPEAPPPSAVAEAPAPASPQDAESESAATPPAEAPAAPETAPDEGSQTAAIPAPPAYQPPEHRVPAPAPDGLTPAPDPNLVEESRYGPLPIVSKDGRKPWIVYARPFDPNDKRPRVSLIISGLGQSRAATDAAIERLPGAVTLAFSPYAKNLDQWITLARAAGHEALLTIPMEPLEYPENDPGPHTLLTSLSDKDNHDRLMYLLSRVAGYVGVLNTMGARMTTTPKSLKPILEDIQSRGLMFVDARSSLRSVAASEATEIGLPRAINNRFIDIKAARAEIDQRLEELERIAKEGGYALGIGSPYPVTIERIVLWAQDLDSRGIALAPVTALADKQPN
jgi:polysaccharide deacetylase 2 family uncharacterized protein YibQ